MAWDKDKPAGTTKVRLSDEEIRANWAALEDAIARNHTFPGTLGGTAGEHSTFELRDQAGDLSQESGLIKIWNNSGALRFIVPGGSARYLESVPAGAIMLFGAASAPTGWTKKTDWSDKSAIVYTTGTPAAAGTQDPCNFSGIAAAEASHTHTGGAHDHGLNSHTHTGPSHSHTGPSHTHAASTTYAENWTIPTPGRAGDSGGSAPVDHTHSVAVNSGGTGSTGLSGTGATGAASGNTASGGSVATGAGSSHTHTLTTPRYQQVIAATRD